MILWNHLLWLVTCRSNLVDWNTTRRNKPKSAKQTRCPIDNILLRLTLLVTSSLVNLVRVMRVSLLLWCHRLSRGEYCMGILVYYRGR